MNGFFCLNLYRLGNYKSYNVLEPTNLVVCFVKSTHDVFIMEFVEIQFNWTTGISIFEGIHDDYENGNCNITVYYGVIYRNITNIFTFL